MEKGEISVLILILGIFAIIVFVIAGIFLFMHYKTNMAPNKTIANPSNVESPNETIVNVTNLTPEPLPDNTTFSNGCIGEDCKGTIILILDNNLRKDLEVKSRIETYIQDNSEYGFQIILFNKTNEPIINIDGSGEDIKKNSLEIRNTLKKMYEEDVNKMIRGVFIIGNIHPTIWRDANLWMDLDTSKFVPSIYPFVALDNEYYNNFSVENDGFYEKPGVTNGSGIGDGYNATIWGAVLIPDLVFYSYNTNNLYSDNIQKPIELILSYFDRDHNYRTGKLIYNDKILYSNSWGCSTGLYQKLNNSQKADNSLFWHGKNFTMLCPNFNPELNGFGSSFHVIIHNNGPDYNPSMTGSWNSIDAVTEAEKNEFEDWTSKDLFGNSKLVPMEQETFSYEFQLQLTGRSVSTQSIKEVIENNLPPLICSRLSCDVFVSEEGFIEKGGAPLNKWTGYEEQQYNWTRLYKTSLTIDKGVQLTCLVTHGAPTAHLFGISSNDVKNSNFTSLIYEIEACNAGNYLAQDYLAENYLFYGNALAVTAYSMPFVIRGVEGYNEENETLRFLRIKYNEPIIDSLFLKNYENMIYFGDPLLEIHN